MSWGSIWGKVKHAFSDAAHWTGTRLYEGTTITLGALDIITSPTGAARLIVYTELNHPSGHDMLHMLEVAGQKDIKNPVFLCVLTMELMFIVMPEEGLTMEILESAGAEEITGLQVDGLSYDFDEVNQVNVISKDSLSEVNGEYRFNREEGQDSGFDSDVFCKKATMRK